MFYHILWWSCVWLYIFQYSSILCVLPLSLSRLMALSKSLSSNRISRSTVIVVGACSPEATMESGAIFWTAAIRHIVIITVMQLSRWTVWQGFWYSLMISHLGLPGQVMSLKLSIQTATIGMERIIQQQSLLFCRITDAYSSPLPAIVMAIRAYRIRRTWTVSATAAFTGLRLRTRTTSLTTWTSTAAMLIWSATTIGTRPALSVSSQMQNKQLLFLSEHIKGTSAGGVPFLRLYTSARIWVQKRRFLKFPCRKRQFK